MKRSSIAAVAVLITTAVSMIWAQDDETRRHLLHELGGPFFVYRAKVQEDLKLSDEQKQKLVEALPDYLPEAAKVFQKAKDLKPAEREKTLQSHRQQSYSRFEAVLKETLNAEQFKRFQQLKLQYDSPATFAQPDLGKELNVSNEQRKQFIGAIQEMQKKIGPLMKEAQSGGNAIEIRGKVVKLRYECEAQIVALMTDAQKQQWKSMIGEPLNIWEE